MAKKLPDLTGEHFGRWTEIGWCDCSQWENDYYNIETDADDFCSYGERKEGAD